MKLVVFEPLSYCNVVSLDKERCFMLFIIDCRGEVSLRGEGKGNFARARRFPFTPSLGAPCAPVLSLRKMAALVGRAN